MDSSKSETPKYAVLKWDDWLRVRNAAEHEHVFVTSPHALLVPDAEVIRHQDVTSAPIFYQYANSIMGFVDMTETMGLDLAEERKEGLYAIADHFLLAADKAQHVLRKKLPD